VCVYIYIYIFTHTAPKIIYKQFEKAPNIFTGGPELSMASAGKH